MIVGSAVGLSWLVAVPASAPASAGARARVGPSAVAFGWIGAPLDIDISSHPSPARAKVIFTDEDVISMSIGVLSLARALAIVMLARLAGRA